MPVSSEFAADAGVPEAQPNGRSDLNAPVDAAWPVRIRAAKADAASASTAQTPPAKPYFVAFAISSARPVAVAQDRQHRSEDLLLCDAHVRCDVGEHRRPD